MKTISISYALVWQIQDAKEYKWSKCGKCFNTKTNKELKQVYNSRCLGYNIKGKFRSLKQIRKQLVKIEEVECPF
ncbi:MAG: hypothetical protein WC939_02855 [Acholeplasmataceae bacterium]